MKLFSGALVATVFAAALATGCSETPHRYSEVRPSIEVGPGRTIEAGETTRLGRLERVEVALAEGVMDLDDHHPKRSGRIAAEVEAGRVEDVPEDAQVGHERDPPVAGRVTLGAEMRPDVGVEVPCWFREMVGVTEGDEAAAVSPHEPHAAGDLVQLGEVECEVEDVVLELIRERLGPAVADLAGV